MIEQLFYLMNTRNDFFCYSKKLITEKKIKVNITDVKMFIYNKTIGPLKINDKKISNLF